MKISYITNSFYFCTSILLSACIVSPSTTNDSSNFNKDGQVELTETIEVSIVCNKSNINEYLDKGWKIQSATVSKVPCTWKTQKATPKCNLKRDKGCSITVPDIIGNKTIYVLIKTDAQ